MSARRPVRVGQVWLKTGFGGRTWPLTVVGIIDVAEFCELPWLYVLLGRNVLGVPYLICLNEIGVRSEARCVRDLHGLS